MIASTFYRMAGIFAPEWASRKVAQRHERALLSELQVITGQKQGYFSAIGSFLKNPLRWFGSHSENAVPPEQFPQLTGNAWEIYRTNPHFRKIVRSLCAKVIGRGLRPNSQAKNPSGKADNEFRARAKQLWEECQGAIDYRGRPGQGGKTFVGIQHLALKTVMLSGEQLFKLRPLTQVEQDARSLPVPLVVQLIDPERLADDMAGVEIESGHAFYRGIELDADRMRYGYWLRDYEYTNGNVTQLSLTAQRYSASSLFHLYAEDDDEQLRGTSWFAAALMPARHGNDLRFNFVKCSAMQACVVLSYSMPPGKTGFGAKGNPNDANQDPAGNKITRFAPGMIIEKGEKGNVEMHSPNINIAGYDGLIASVARDEAAALPGIKASTVTGDYRNSSFSSERSADNDAWPEIEVVQDWFASHFCQPIYEAIVTAAVAEGYFNDVPGFSRRKFVENRAAYLRCSWQGPVARSINPVDDENASEMRLRGGRSSPQKECAKNGTNFDENLDEIAEAYEKIKARKLPEVFFNSMMGLDSKDLLSTAETTAATANGGANVAEKQTA